MWHRAQAFVYTSSPRVAWAAVNTPVAAETSPGDPAGAAVADVPAPAAAPPLTDAEAAPAGAEADAAAVVPAESAGVVDTAGAALSVVRSPFSAPAHATAPRSVQPSTVIVQRIVFIHLLVSLQSPGCSQPLLYAPDAKCDGAVRTIV